VDNRFPIISGHHQKFFVTYRPDNDWQAVVGSADFFLARWDDRQHLPDNPHRPGGPTHDMAVMVKGPATVDIALTFAERWNDLKTSKQTDPPITRALSTAVDNPPPEVGSHSVQVLRTYPLMKYGKGYSWSNVGEYTVWASYINAIKQAQTYIYIEDQYLYPLGDPPFIYSDTGRKRETDFVYQLGEALKRGVDVVTFMPGRNDSLPKYYENQPRRRATECLARTTKMHPDSGRFVVVKPHIDGKDIMVHSKVVTVAKGAFGGGAIGLLLAGPGAGLLAGAVVGAVVGSSRAKERRETKALLDDKLGPDDSALVILINDVDWERAQASVEHFGGEDIVVELTPGAERQLAAPAADEGFAAAVQEEAEVEEVDDGESGMNEADARVEVG
jgi:uncharacterized membrane protein